MPTNPYPSIERAKIALVHDWLTVPGGSEDVFRHMCDLFSGVVFTSQWDRDRIHFVADREVRTSFVQNLPGSRSKHYLYSPLLPHAYRSFDMNEFELILTSSHSFAHSVQPRTGAKHICYYHTPARSLWVPEVDNRATTGRFAPLKRLIAARLRKLDFEASKSPTHRIANSKTTADRIRRFYGQPVDAVIYPPVETTKWSTVPRQSDDLGLLYWGRLIPYKRVDLLIEVARQTGERLQIVGSGPLETPLKESARDLPNVTFHGRLSDADLMSVMARCRAFVFPAYEDFGIVAVEAMAAGLPVVCYTLGGAAESVTPEHGTHFEEQTPASIIRAIQALSNLRFDPTATRNHAAQFDSTRFRAEYRSFVEAATLDDRFA